MTIGRSTRSSWFAKVAPSKCVRLPEDTDVLIAPELMGFRWELLRDRLAVDRELATVCGDAAWFCLDMLAICLNSCENLATCLRYCCEDMMY